MPCKNTSGCWNITVIRLLSWTKPRSWLDWSQEKWSLESKQAETQQQNAVHQECIPETIHIVNIKLSSDTWLTYREFYPCATVHKWTRGCTHVCTWTPTCTCVVHVHLSWEIFKYKMWDMDQKRGTSSLSGHLTQFRFQQSESRSNRQKILQF